MRVTPESVGTETSRVRSMPVVGAAPGDRPTTPVASTGLTRVMRGLRTALLYVLVAVVSFVGAVVLYSIVESLWLGRG